ncbi:MAG: threonine dehydratase [Microvirga sp.]
MFSLDDLDRAAGVVRSVMPPTLQYAWPLLRQRFGVEVVVKHENHTPIGAFKVRGGLTYVERLNRERTKVKGIVSATRGNHGQSLAFAGRHFKVPVVVVVPYGNSVEKNAAMRALGAEIVVHGIDFDDAKQRATELAKERGYEYVPSFHPDLIVGVATYAHELFHSHPDLDVVYAPIGLGSGICGLIRTRDLLGLKTDVVGVVSNLSNAYRLSFDAGRVVSINSASTFADGIAVRVPDPDAVAMIHSGARAVIEVSDHDIATAIRTYHEGTHNLGEGAGAAALAGLAVDRDHARGGKAAVILSGGNIDRPWASLALAGQTPSVS